MRADVPKRMLLISFLLLIVLPARRRQHQLEHCDLRLRADGSIVPRNSLVGRPIHKVDLRLQQRLPLFGRVAVDGIVEVFNLFNHENYGSYVTNQSNANFGQPAANTNAQYFPRVLQFGVRATF